MIEAFTRTQNFNILCLSGIFLDSTINFSDGKIKINGYSILKAISFNSDPSNTKRGVACIYFKQSLPLFIRDDISAMQETTVKQI